MFAGSAVAVLVPELPDAELVTRIALGDVTAFEQVVRRYSGAVHSMAMRMLGNRADAEDAVQDGFLTVWHRAGEIVEPAALRTWLLQVVRRRCLIALRSRRTRRTNLVGQVPEHRVVIGAALVADPQRAVEAGAGVLALGQALAGLPPRQRDVWVLAEVDGLSHGEISRRVGAGEQAVRVRLSRARAKLAETMRAWR